MILNMAPAKEDVSLEDRVALSTLTLLQHPDRLYTLLRSRRARALSRRGGFCLNLHGLERSVFVIMLKHQRKEALSMLLVLAKSMGLTAGRRGWPGKLSPFLRLYIGTARGGPDVYWNARHVLTLKEFVFVVDTLLKSRRVYSAMETWSGLLTPHRHTPRTHVHLVPLLQQIRHLVTRLSSMGVACISSMGSIDDDDEATDQSDDSEHDSVDEDWKSVVPPDRVRNKLVVRLFEWLLETLLSMLASLNNLPTSDLRAAWEEAAPDPAVSITLTHIASCPIPARWTRCVLYELLSPLHVVWAALEPYLQAAELHPAKLHRILLLLQALMIWCQLLDAASGSAPEPVDAASAAASAGAGADAGAGAAAGAARGDKAPDTAPPAVPGSKSSHAKRDGGPEISLRRFAGLMRQASRVHSRAGNGVNTSREKYMVHAMTEQGPVPDFFLRVISTWGPLILSAGARDEKFGLVFENRFLCRKELCHCIPLECKVQLLLRELREARKTNQGRGRSHSSSPRLDVTVNRTTADPPSQRNALAKLLMAAKPPVYSVSVSFKDEPGVGDGPIREFFNYARDLLVEKVDDPDAPFDGRLFQPGATEDFLLLRPVPVSELSQHQKDVLVAVGHVLALSIIAKHPMGCHLPRGLCRAVMGLGPATLEDMKEVDPALHAGLSALRNGPDVAALDMTFTTSPPMYSRAGTEVPLCIGGDAKPVTAANVAEFCDLKAGFALAPPGVTDLLAQGFQRLLPHASRSFLLPEDMQRLVVGTTFVDVEEFLDLVLLDGFSSYGVPVIQWLFAWVRSLTPPRLRQLLLFWSGQETLPLLTGSDMTDQPFVIEHSYAREGLPTAGTCSRRLLLPAYPSARALRDAMDLAIEYGCMGYTRA